MITLKLNPYSDEAKQTLLHALAVAHTEILHTCDANCQCCKNRQPCDDIDRCVRYLQTIVNSNPQES